MPKYIVLQTSFIDAKVVHPGEEIEYAGLPAENLQPTDDEGRAKYQEYLESNEARVKKMILENKEPSAGGIADSAVFFEALQKQRAQDQAEMPGLVAQAVAAALAASFPNGMHKPAVAPAESLT